jgi:hypothetical protein
MHSRSTGSVVPERRSHLTISSEMMRFLLMISACSFSLCSASASAVPSHSMNLQSVSLHSIQTLPLAAFPTHPITKRCVPYQIADPTDPCSFALAMHDSPFNNEPLHVVPPFTGYPRASAVGNGDACSDEIDVCAQAFRLSLQVPRAGNL